MSLWKMRDSATDEQLVECIRSQCDLDKIRNGAIENGGNQVGILGLLIEEIGIRKITNTAPIVVEYVAWPYYDDFWVHLVPRCFETLAKLCDDSIVERLMHLTSADVAAKKLLDILDRVRPDIAEQEQIQPYDSDPLIDLRSRLIMAALEENMVGKQAIKKWADAAIGMANQVPPDWLCDLSMHGQFFLRHAPEDIEVNISFKEKCFMFIAFYKTGKLTFVDTLERICRGAINEYPVGVKAIVLTLNCPAFQNHEQISEFQSQIEKRFEYIYKQIPIVATTTKELVA